MDSYLKALQYEKIKSSDGVTAESPLVAEFLKSYKEMKKKIQQMGAAQGRNSAISREKKTFTGLTKGMVEGVGSTNLSSSHMNLVNSSSYNRLTIRKTDRENPNSKLTFDRKQSEILLDKGRKRPMSAKNPMLI